ncbi:MAG: MMPL family transporter [Candidatus Omnitrophota bacterium]
MKKIPTNKEIITYLLLTFCSLFVLFSYINLTPQIGRNLFFSSSDPQLQQERKISKSFKRQGGQLIISIEGQIKSRKYYEKMSNLTKKINSLKGVGNAFSISNGPRNIHQALQSPLWRRLLIAGDNSTYIMISLKKDLIKKTINSIEALIEKTATPDFKPYISGAPYITNLIQKNLLQDFKTFSFLALFIFSLVIIMTFRSLKILVGTLVSCVSASVWTLIMADLFNIQIGLLTANLSTIIFVLTLSHIVFLTYNWKHAKPSEAKNNMVGKAIGHTLPPSFWSMVTTLLGFLSLFLVPAKPLRELGISGSIGTVIAFICAYTIYPYFLKTVKHPKKNNDRFEIAEHWLYAKFKNKKRIIITIIITLVIISSAGLRLINNDPSLLSYFNKNSKISKGLARIDRQGGSTPLLIVVKSRKNEKLNTTQAYKKLWNLQESLEKNESIGTVLSLAVLMKEAKSSFFSFFFSWESLLQSLEKPKYGKVAKSFITDNREKAMFMLRMKEQGREKQRLKIIEEIKETVRDVGFIPETAGGIYLLQGHLAKLVTKSLLSGLFRLLLLFFFIGWFVSRSLRISIAMTLTISFVPVIVLGLLGLAKIPLDVIATPAINVSIAMGIDSMIHMVTYLRRIKPRGLPAKETWEKARKRLWAPVLNTMIIITIGFGIFFFSHFPPTQRFGGIIVFGAFIAALISLYLMPFFAKFKNNK